MKVEYKKIVKVDELEHLVPRKAGATFSQLWHVFYYTRLLKYVTYRHYAQIKRSFNKICTYKNLQELCKLGYLKSPRNKVYCATDKVIPIIREAGFITETLPAEPHGKGDINELNNTEAFISLMKEPYFHTFLYPHFGYLIPDALMVQLNSESKRFKLTFIEVESKKPEWEQYIKNKENNYLRLSTDLSVLEKWNEYAFKLGLPQSLPQNFKFTYKIVKNGSTSIIS